MDKNFSVREVSVFDWTIKFFDFGDVSLPNSLYIQGQLHSNEVNSFTTLYSLVEKLKKNPPPIPVRIVPCCNPIGWETHLHGYDGRVSNPGKLDWNRIFKETPRRTGTIECELASELWALSEGFSRIIDVHTPDYGFPHVYTNDINTRLLAFDDIPYVIADEATDGSFQNLNSKERSVPSFTIELPSYDVWTQLNQDYWVDRICKEIFTSHPESVNIFKELPKYFGKLVNLYATISGVPLVLVKPNEIAKANSKIVNILSLTGEIEILTFDRDCIPLCFRRRGLIEAGRMVTKVLSLNQI